MIKKEIINYRIHNRCVLQKSSDVQCQVKSRNQSEEKIILLINPLVIKGSTTDYDLNDRNNFDSLILHFSS